MVSNEFINECKNRANSNRLGQIIVDGIESQINQSNNLQSIEIDSGCYVDGNIIGSVYAKCLKANFIAEQNNLTDKSMQAQVGVKYDDLSTEYINIGKYKVERPNNEITANMSQITAYDDLYTNLDNKYICNIDYSDDDITLSDLYADVCNQLGLIPVTTTFINSTIPIKENPFTNGEKNRTVLQTIAKISCSFIDIDNDTNKIDLCWLSQNEEPDYIFYKNDYVNVEGGQIVCGPINCLIIKNSQIDDENIAIKDEESIATYGEHSIIISEDYILYNAESREQAIIDIWNRVKGMKYVDCKLTTYYGKPFLKLGNKIRIYISENEYFDTYVLKHNFTYDGSFTSIIESPALTEQEIKTKQDISLGESLKNTQVIVNKQEGKIQFLSEEQTEQNKKMSQLTQTIDQIQTQIQDIPTITVENEGIGNLFLSNLLNTRIIYLNIYPTDRDILGMFASTQLKSSKSLKSISRKIYFVGNEKFSYMIPTNLYYYDESIHDEFVYDGQNKKIYVIHRIGIDENGNKFLLENEIQEDFEYYDFLIGKGDYNIFMSTYPTAYISIKAMLNNDYTNEFATKYEVNSAITQTANEINLKVSKKVDENEIISTINQSAEEVKIKANKIGLEGYTTINEGFSVDEEGNMTCNGATAENLNINSGKIILYTDNTQEANDTSLTIYDKNNKYRSTSFYGDGFIVSDLEGCMEASMPPDKGGGNCKFKMNGGYSGLEILTYYNSIPTITLWATDPNGGKSSDSYSELSSNGLYIGTNTETYTNINNAIITTDEVNAKSFNNISLEEKKKNIEKYKNGLNIIKKSDIYKFNYKTENNDEKQHIGLVIGDKYNTPDEIISNNGKSIDLYSMVSVCFQAIKEQQQIIEKLQQEVQQLRSDK